MQNLTNPKSIIWTQVLDTWRDQESWHHKWEEHFQSQGFKTWDEWRQEYWQPIGLEKLKWQEFEIQDPESFFSKCWLGPFTGWKKFSNNKQIIFENLIENPKVENLSAIQSLFQNFPSNTVLIGLQIDEKIIIFDGTNRSCSLALAFKKGLQISGKVKLHLANLSPSVFAKYQNPSLQKIK